MKILKQLKEKAKYMMISFSTFMLMGMPVFATGTKPGFVTGTEKLMSDLTKWILGGLTAIVVLMILVTGVKWYLAEEEEKPKHTKTIKKQLVMGVFLLLVDVIVAFVFSYYQ